MAAPEYVPASPTDKVRVPWESPAYVPDPWTLNRPAEVACARQPVGPRLGYQGPDQGYALALAETFRPRLRWADGEHEPDVVTGCVLIATRRSSLFGRAPVIHDLTISFTMWGFLDDAPPPDLVALRRARFEGASHDYETARAVVDAIPEETLRMTPQQVSEAYPSRWRELVGA